MVENLTLASLSLSEIADDVARSLSYARSSGTSAFVTTAVTYPNGSAVVARIDEGSNGYTVSDDGYGALTAEMMGALSTFGKVAGAVAQRSGLNFDQRSIFVLKVTADQLASAVALVVNASAMAIERTLVALDQTKTKRSRAVFEDRLKSAFGKLVRFAVPIRGVTRGWDVDGAVLDGARVRAVFEFVPPAYSAVASAHMKLGDLRGLTEPPVTTAVLADYSHTEASLRSILSNATDFVIGASEPVERYQTAS